jgi:hypothetical protein
MSASVPESHDRIGQERRTLARFSVLILVAYLTSLKERSAQLSLGGNWQQEMEPPPPHVRTTNTSPGNPRKIHDDA